jgi:His-Xaa-Ser system protein HxsD
MPDGVGVAAFRRGEDVLGAFVQVDVDTAVYSETAVLKTAYWFTDSHYLFLSRLPGGTVLTVELRQKQATSLADLQAACGEFANRLLDAEVRQRVLAETSTVRDTLIRKAFFEAKAPLPKGVLSDESRIAQPGQTEQGDPVGATRRA